MLRNTLIICSIFVLCINAASANENNCIASSKAAINGLLPGMNHSSVKMSNKFISKEVDVGEDDGGGYEAQTYHYKNYDITIVRETIDSIVITSPVISWAEGIKIGKDRAFVENKLTMTPVANEIYSSQYLVCSSAGDIYAIFTYKSGILDNIKIVIDRP